jgi:pimeloyl-ACP methyl ester carboxylesterase
LTANQPAKLGAAVGVADMLFGLHGGGVAGKPRRLCWRCRPSALASGQPPPAVKVPVGFTTFPGEIWASPRSWVEAVYPDLAYFNEAEKGGHFAAWEEPQLFSEELRAAFRSLR